MGDIIKNPVRILFHEHEIILEAIEVAKQTDMILAKDEQAYLKVIRYLIGFFRDYADTFHHYKEERILFPEMNRKNELLEEGVIKEMFENHEDFRSMIQSMENFLNEGEYRKVQRQLHIYIEAILDHIAVENDEVFHMAEALFDKDELEKLYFLFEDFNRESGEQMKTGLVNQLNQIKASLE